MTCRRWSIPPGPHSNDVSGALRTSSSRTRSRASELSIDELDWLATAAYLTGRDDEAFELWAAVHRACIDAGDVARAARVGVQLSHAYTFKGDIARGSGWVERVRRVLGRRRGGWRGVRLPDARRRDVPDLRRR